ncbi:DUF397 domain-containing protein [Pseudonocardiaceae bacterium YIM PH 21723]|nr:DUF397 domain-containing protein [Pseudonocardiaceae bacterium YIM PH 21723]
MIRRGSRGVPATLLDATWRKSSRSGASNGTGGECVEVAVLTEHVATRDSKNAGGAVLMFPASQWSRFVGGIKHGEFNN